MSRPGSRGFDGAENRKLLWKQDSIPGGSRLQSFFLFLVPILAFFIELEHAEVFRVSDADHLAAKAIGLGQPLLGAILEVFARPYL